MKRVKLGGGRVRSNQSLLPGAIRALCVFFTSSLLMVAIAASPGWGATATFDAGAEGWTVAVLLAPPSGNPPVLTDTFYPEWLSYGGNPGGNIQATDPGPNAFFFSAPWPFLGDQSESFGSFLSYDMRLSGQGGDGGAVILVGPTMTLYAYLGQGPGVAWKTIHLQLVGRTFRVNDLTGPPATDLDLQAVLANVQSLYILGDWITGRETAYLDNVVLGPLASACCLAAFCTLMDRTQCGAYGGIYQGDGVPCDPNPCPTSNVDGNSAVGPSGLRAMPCPSRGEVVIFYELPAATPVTLEIFNASGRLVRRLVAGPEPAGRHEIRLDGRDEGGKPLPWGVYLTRVRTMQGLITGRIVLAQ